MRALLRLRRAAVAAKESAARRAFRSRVRLLGHQRKIAVIGLGYVGLPVAVAFARSGAAVIGFDVDRNRIDELRAGVDRTCEVETSDLAHPTLLYTGDPAALAAADFYIVTVPTPIDAARRPDLAAMFAASDTVGHFLKRGDIVVYESTVYPGAVEEDCAPRLERTSGLRCGADFTVGYSPERINHGDKAHRWTYCCLADGLSVCHVVFLPLHKRLYVSRRDKTNLVALGLNLTRPTMRASTGFHRYYALRLRRQKGK